MASTDVYPLLTPDSEDWAMISLIQMRWGEPQSELSPEDWREYQRLCQPGSPNFLLSAPDYYAFFTYSMFHGKVAK
jgi:demethylmenaquinone methyltransferase/2-methoxy-6-polyprenyl-1,4-benzoquinol methylase